MARYRKKPVVIDAFQLPPRRCPIAMPAWAIDNRDLQVIDVGVQIATLEGTMLASWGDWIVRGVKGELYPVKPDIFAKTYHTTPLDSFDDAASA